MSENTPGLVEEYQRWVDETPKGSIVPLGPGGVQRLLDTITDLRTALELLCDGNSEGDSCIGHPECLYYTKFGVRCRWCRGRQALTRIHEPSNEQAQVIDLRTALEETNNVLTAMLKDEDWPPERLAPRLSRLQTIVSQALTHIHEPSNEEGK